MLLVSLLLFSWRSCLADGQDSMPLEDDLLLQGEKPADNTTHYEGNLQTTKYVSLTVSFCQYSCKLCIVLYIDSSDFLPFFKTSVTISG